MFELAQKYAATLNTSVLAHRIDGETIIFVLESGPKLTMTRAELEAALNTKSEEPEKVETKKKGKSK